MKIKIQIVSFVVLAFSIAQICEAQSDERDNYVPDVWTTTKSFVKAIDSGNLHAPLIDRYHPPALELDTLLWNRRLTVSGELHNIGLKPVKIRGYEVIYPESGKAFYPLCTLQVSNEIDRGWEAPAIGLSPVTSGGMEKVISLAPDSVRLKWSVLARRISHCEIELDDFRPLIGKFKYGRVVLDSGGSSQVLALVDLLPEKKDPSIPYGVFRNEGSEAIWVRLLRGKPLTEFYLSPKRSIAVPLSDGEIQVISLNPHNGALLADKKNLIERTSHYYDAKNGKFYYRIADKEIEQVLPEKGMSWDQNNGNQ